MGNFTHNVRPGLWGFTDYRAITLAYSKYTMLWIIVEPCLRTFSVSADLLRLDDCVGDR